MRKKKVGAIAIKSFALLVVLGTAYQATAQDTTTPYPNMAPINQYLMPHQGAGIALARSAATESISRDAEVLILGRHGFETAVKGKNGFVCIVERSWTSAADADFWNPKVRVPICLNAPAARSYLLHLTKETEQGYGGDSIPHWPSHLMFFYSDTDPRHGLPVAICVENATPHEVKLATNTLVQIVIPDAPQNLVGDNAYDSDKLDSELRRYGIELIAPRRMNRKNTTQDLRRL